LNALGHRFGGYIILAALLDGRRLERLKALKSGPSIHFAVKYQQHIKTAA